MSVVHANRFLVRFVARFAVLSAGLLLLCWALPLLSFSENLVVATADQLLGLTEQAPDSHSIVIDGAGNLRLHSATRWRDSVVQTGRSRLLNYSHSLVHRPYYVYSHNLLVFVVLVLATPGLGWRQRGVAVVVGSSLIVGLDALILTADVWEVDRQYVRQYLPQLAQHTSPGVLARLLTLVRSLHPTGGAFMTPVFVWGFVLVSPVVAQPSREMHPPSQRWAARNSGTRARGTVRLQRSTLRCSAAAHQDDGAPPGRRA